MISIIFVSGHLDTFLILNDWPDNTLFIIIPIILLLSKAKIAFTTQSALFLCTLDQWLIDFLIKFFKCQKQTLSHLQLSSLNCKKWRLERRKVQTLGLDGLVKPLLCLFPSRRVRNPLSSTQPYSPPLDLIPGYDPRYLTGIIRGTFDKFLKIYFPWN